jgi:hypothetical protein
MPSLLATCVFTSRLPGHHPWQATFQQQVLAQLLQMTEQNRQLLAGRPDGR